jgi:hypothetical protein
MEGASLSLSLSLSLSGGWRAALPHGALSALQLLPQPPHRRRIGLGARLGPRRRAKQSAALVPRGATCERSRFADCRLRIVDARWVGDGGGGGGGGGRHACRAGAEQTQRAVLLTDQCGDASQQQHKHVRHIVHQR